MASTLQFLHHSLPLHLTDSQQYQKTTPSSSLLQLHHPVPRPHHFRLECTSISTPQPDSPNPSNSNPEPETEFPDPGIQTTISAEKFPIEKRRRSEIIRDRKARTGLVKPEPPNFEIGWKRTKSIPLEKPKGYVIMDYLQKLVELMDRELFGSIELLAKAGEIVAERAREEAEVLMDEGEVDERMVTELSRVLKLMEMDLAMVKASVKQETLNERLEQAKARCRQAILVANSL